MTTAPVLTRDQPEVSGTWSATASAPAPPSFGVEEEFLLLDPVVGRPVPAAPDLLRLLAGEAGVRAELMRFQFEVATPVCTSLADLRAELIRLRGLAACGATALGCRLVASGVSPYGTQGLTALTDDARYLDLARRHPGLIAEYGTCGCHVHIGVPSRDIGVQVLARLRPWLTSLLAISANSPVYDGRDTGWASWRYRIVARWPTARPPAVWPDAAAYDATVRRLIRNGAALDESSVYFHARLSPRYPTVEIRIADVCPDIDMTVLVAALARALVATALEEVDNRAPLPRASPQALVPGLTAAARFGLAGTGVDPFTGEPASQRDLLHRLLDHVSGALDGSGDLGYVSGLLTLLASRCCGADQQRTLWRQGLDAPAFIEALADRTLATPMPPIDGASQHTREDECRQRESTAPANRGAGCAPSTSTSSTR